MGRPSWVVYDSEVATIHARLDDFQRQGLAEDVAFARDAAAHFTGLPSPPSHARAHFFLLGNHPLLRRHRESRDHGFAVRDTPAGAYYVIDGRRRLGETRRGLLKAMIHLHLSSGPVPTPAWYQIGFSAVMDTLQIGRERIAVGKVDPVLLRQLRSLERWKVSDLIEPGFLAQRKARERRGYEAVAWLMTHYLTVDVEGETGAPPRDRLDQFRAALALGASPAAALEAAWGLTPHALGQRIRARAAGRLKVPQVAIGKLARSAPPDPRQRLPRGELARERAALHAAFGDAERAAELLEEALREDPRDALALAASSHLKAGAGALAAAEVDADRAVALAPDDPRVLAARARIDVLRAAASPQREQRARYLSAARDQLDFALAIAPSDPVLLWSYAETWRTIPGEPLAPALAPLERAHALHPADRRIRLALLEAYVRSEHGASARRLAASLLTDARTPGQVERIESLLAPLGGLETRPWLTVAQRSR